MNVSEDGISVRASTENGEEGSVIAANLKNLSNNSSSKKILVYPNNLVNMASAGTVYPHVDKYLNQAVDEYNAALHVPVTHLPPVPRRSVHAAAAPAQSAPEAGQPQGDVLSRIASALVRGQQKRVLQLCSEALESGHGAQEILTDGLVRGMTILGEDFSANRAFVPEMLIAARCMAAATELLKPYMTGESSETIGRVCLGTVRGDMHDIGKNLVKIMMEEIGRAHV